MNKINLSFMLFSDGIGGAEQVVLELIKNIDKSRFNVFLIVNNEIMQYFENYVSNDKIYNIGNLYRFTNNNFINRIINKGISIYNLKKNILNYKLLGIEKFIATNKITILHSHLMLDLYTASLLKKRNTNLRLIYTVHGFLNLDNSVKIKYAISHDEFVHYLQDADYITCVSELLISKLIEVVPNLKDKCKFITNGLDKNIISHIKSLVKKNNSENVELLFMGGEKEVKGGLVLLKSIEKLIVEYDVRNFKLTILGPVNMKGTFYSYITNHEILKDYIKVIGFVNSPKHMEYIRYADIVLMPSISEGMPIVLLESIALGTYVLTSNIPIFRTLIQENISGTLVDLDSISLTVSIKQLIENKELRDKVIKNNEHYPIPYWVDVIKEYENIY